LGVCAATTLGLLRASPAQAKQCESVSLPDQLSIDGKKLVLNGMGVREATVFNVNVYVAGLYLENRSKDGEKIAASEELKRMQLVFVRDVSRADMADAIHEGFKKVAGGELGKLEARIEKLKGLLPELKNGDRLSFTYRPGKGLEVASAKRTGVIEGADFARYMLLIWLGAHPPNAGLKRGLLGGECG
jgi:hypothetical protein